MNVVIRPSDDLDLSLIEDGACGAKPPIYNQGLVLVWDSEIVTEGVDRAIRCGAPLDLESRLNRAMRGLLRWDLVMPRYVGALNFG